MVDIDFELTAYNDIPTDRRPSLIQSLVPVLGMIVFLGVSVIILDLDPQLPLVWSLVLTGATGRYWIGISWDDLYRGMIDSLQMGMQAILILFVIYMLIAVLTAAGTIPALIYYGLNILSPQVFLPATAIISAVIAFTIGSSWTAAGTLGVAFMGISSGLGIPAPMTAGAILTGAYTGDKNSPLSDTTNLAAAVTNTDLMTHVRTMRAGTSIAFLISVLGYTVLGFGFRGSIPAEQVQNIQTAVASTYDLSLFVFIPLLIMFGLAFRGYPALPSLMVGVFTGAAVMIGIQGVPFPTVWEIAQSGTDPHTGVKVVNNLLKSDGLMGSMWTITIIVAALSLGGLLERTGILAALAYHLRRIIHDTTSLTIGTGATAFSMNLLTAEPYMSIVIPGMTLRELYNEYELESRNLSRAVEAAGTATTALIPWNAGGVYMAGVLGVPTLEYAPYYFFGFLSPIVLVAMALTGWRITHQPASDATAQSNPGSAND